MLIKTYKARVAMEFTGERFIPSIVGNISLEHMHRYRFCLDFIVGKDVLDIACGEGYGSALIAPDARKVWGVDISVEAVGHAQEAYKAENLQFLLGSCTAIPLPDNSVDVAISFETIEHLTEHDEMMQELRRVLRPNGVLIISSPDKRVYSDEQDFHNSFHLRELYAKDFAALLHKNFGHVVTYAQNVVFGSAILRQSGEGKLASIGIGDTKFSAGLASPMYQVAVASDSADWLNKGFSGLMEDSVFHSEAVMEKASIIAKLEAERENVNSGNLVAYQTSAELTQLIGHISNFVNAVSDLPNHIANLTYHLTPPSQPVKRSRLNKMGFHPSGKPRGWLRFILLNDQQLGTPRPTTSRILFKKSGVVRPIFRGWYRGYEISPENAVLYSYTQMLRKQRNLEKAKTICVVCTPHTVFIAEAVAQALAGTRLNVTYVTKMPRDFTHDLYVVIAAQMFDHMPPLERCFIFQMEQVRASRWVDAAYLERLRTCLGVIDYAFDNITALIERGLLLKQLFYVPIQPFAKHKALPPKRDIDVLFYGAQGSPRRDRYLAALSKRVNVRVETNLFGDQMTDLLSRAKVVVNIHYYENALLETTRLSEALSHGAFVVSEQSADHADQTDFDDLVDFVASDDVEAFVLQVETRLHQWTSPQNVSSREDVGSMKFLLLRALHGCGVLTFTEFADATQNTKLPSNSLVLGLPEEAPRRRSAQQNRLPAFAAFPALRNVDGWKGCAQSYKYMASKAETAGLPRLMICEDDAIFAPGTAQRLAIIADYLDQQNSSWDVFSGLLSDLHEDAIISAVTTYKGEKFVHLNSVIGMVFGIYNRSAIKTLEGFEFAGEDTRYHTIDRYFDATKPRCITTVPPIAVQSTEFESTLWLAHNQGMTDMISASQSLLEKKIKDFSDADGIC
jgi:ubiquinone/menaquinone biosynthesis C-methylase UbiE/GR25 family glycosyltransferase involved in LPS biosynthesis